MSWEQDVGEQLSYILSQEREEKGISFVEEQNLLNFANLDELDYNANLFSPRQVRWVEAALRNISYNPQRFGRKNQQWGATTGIFIMLDADHDDAERLAFCTYARRACNRYKVCTYCSHLKRVALASKYLQVFNQGHWYFLTIGLQSPLICESEYDHNLENYWQAFYFAVYQLQKEGLIKGFYGAEELAVSSLYPIPIIKPNSHFLLSLDEPLSPATIRRLHELLSEYRGHEWNSRGKKWIHSEYLSALETPPSTVTRKIHTQADFLRVLRYMVKPINVAKPYQEAWPEASANNRAGVPTLNSNLEMAVRIWHRERAGRFQSYHRGILSGCSANPRGIGTAQRMEDSHIKSTKGLMKELTECIEGIVAPDFDLETLGIPLELQDEPENGTNA